MDNKEICCCFNVTVDDVRKEIEDGVTTFKEVQKRTKMGTECPPCTVESERVFNLLLKEHQQK